jgi:hypothetical protein
MFIWGSGFFLVGAVAATVPNSHLVFYLALVLLLTFIAAAVFSFVAWCCPRCRRPFTVAHRPGICEHCGVVFARKPDANSDEASVD